MTFTYVISFAPLTNPMKQILFIPIFLVRKLRLRDIK